MDVSNICSVDIDTYSEYKEMRGQTMVVFSLLDGDSWSIKYVNYSYSQLKSLKFFLEGLNREIKESSNNN